MAGDWRIADEARHSGRLAAHADVVVACLFSFMAKGERAPYCDAGPTPFPHPPSPEALRAIG